jgi:hypothetical protein
MWVRLPPSAPILLILPLLFGVWLSLVERSVRVAEVGGSNPLTPTTQVGRRHSVAPTVLVFPTHDVGGGVHNSRPVPAGWYGCHPQQSGPDASQ